MKKAQAKQALPLLIERTLEEQLSRCTADGKISVETIINDTLYHEMERLKGEPKTLPNKRKKEFWNEIKHRFPKVSHAEQERILKQIITQFAIEVLGHFDERVYRFATKIIPWGLSALMNRLSPIGLLKSVSKGLNLSKNLVVSGPIEKIRHLSRSATLILVPTHHSNLDSIVIGMALYLCKLPPFIYGAGLNLFTNPILTFFMNNLGAYKIDRRKKSAVYKSVLKNYATISMELGNHNLFFPGGTRNRRGDIERYLKLGLLGCGLDALIRNLQAGKSKPKICVIPCTISYGLVLEANSLIRDHLRNKGQSRYIIDTAGISKPVRIYNFLRNLQTLNSKIHIHFCEPLDLFGFRVDENCISRDGRGRPVDITKFVEKDGIISPDPQRDRQYTCEMGEQIKLAFKQNNIILPTALVSYAVFYIMSEQFKLGDFYRFLRTEGPVNAISKKRLFPLIDTIRDHLQKLEKNGEIRLDPELTDLNAESIYEKAMKHFDSYHAQRVLVDSNGLVYSDNLKLLFYYRNRLDHYNLEEVLL